MCSLCPDGGFHDTHSHTSASVLLLTPTRWCSSPIVCACVKVSLLALCSLLLKRNGVTDSSAEVITHLSGWGGLTTNRATMVGKQPRRMDGRIANNQDAIRPSRTRQRIKPSRRLTAQKEGNDRNIKVTRLPRLETRGPQVAKDWSRLVMEKHHSRYDVTCHSYEHCYKLTR